MGIDPNASLNLAFWVGACFALRENQWKLSSLWFLLLVASSWVMWENVGRGETAVHWIAARITAILVSVAVDRLDRLTNDGAMILFIVAFVVGLFDAIYGNPVYYDPLHSTFAIATYVVAVLIVWNVVWLGEAVNGSWI